MIDDELINPFGVDPIVELPWQPEAVPLWTEYCFFFAYDLDTKTGVTIHIGREPFDPEIWRATMSIFMPGEELLVNKYSGRDGHARGPGAGPLRMSCVEPMRLWTVEFDGVARSISRSQSMSEACRDSSSEPIDFYLSFEGAAPIWDLHKRMSEVMDVQSWGSQHWEQICNVRGHLRRAGKTISFSGAGVRDHSCGPRDYGPVVSNFWANALFPSGKAVMAQLTRSEGLKTEIRNAYVFWADGTPLEIAELVGHPKVNTLETDERSVARDPLSDDSIRVFSIVIDTSRGQQVIEAELQHSAATTYLSPNDELLGTDFTQLDGEQERATQLTESATRYRWNGEVGVGVRERIARLSTLK